MCGFTGIIDSRQGLSSDHLKTNLNVMASAIRHRGPDDAGLWYDREAGVGLAHRRLSVIDPSPDGHQPMISASGRYVIVYNGEIYNFKAIRDELGVAGDAPVWRGHSDTEVFLAAIAAWGVERALQRVTGMFAFALWDRQEKLLYLARDRMGEKPLYYGWQNGVFLFGSELKALQKYPAWRGEVDRNAVALFLRHNYIPAPYSVYRDIKKIPAGTFIKLPVGDQLIVGSWPEPVSYWSLGNVVENSQELPFIGTDAEAVEELDGLLRASIAGQMVADVPLGAFLSGGIDSSIVVALMQELSNRPVKTFSIGFHEEGYDEAQHARAMAQHLGTEHTELYVTSEEAMDVIPQLPRLYDEPFSDSSQIPIYLVSKLARQHVTVSLSGDGGDELFGGYQRYATASSAWKKLALMPDVVRRNIGKGLGKAPAWFQNLLYSCSGAIRAGCGRKGDSSDKVMKLGEVLQTASSPEEFYRGVMSHWKLPEDVVRKSRELDVLFTNPSMRIPVKDFEHRMMYLDAMNYLPDDILVKVDRAAMGVSLETRIPMLDHRVVELAWRLPLSMKIRNGRGKWILRQVLNRYVPARLIERPKMGFGVPIGSWLRGPLREWAEDLLSRDRLQREGVFHPVPIRKKWEEHISGGRNWQNCLWDVLMFQAWNCAEQEGI